MKARAVLAGGLVLGVGAAVTLASWNDAEYASGTLTTSTFNLQSSLTNVPADFSDHPLDAPLVIPFAATDLAPGSLRQRQVFIRNTGNISGTYTFAVPTMFADDPLLPLVNYLKYRAVETSASCSAASFANGATFLAGSPGNWADIGATPAVTRNIAAGGTVVGICIELKLEAGTPNDRQGKTATVQFVTTAKSVTP